MNITDILKMDGRKRAPVIENIWRGARPYRKDVTPPSVATVRRVCSIFKESGQSNHSGMAHLLPYLVAYCEAERIPYSLKSAFSKGKCYGYYLKREEEL